MNLWDANGLKSTPPDVETYIDGRVRQLIKDPASNHEGMLYAIRNKPDSLLIYPAFK
jgi:hypothetical protein